MTEPDQPDDRALEQYLKGASALSRKYRDASRETAPPELDAAVLAQARAAVRRPRRAGWGTGLALAASMLLAVNLGWNVWRAEPAPDAVSRSLPAAPAPQPAAPPPPAAVEDARAPEPAPTAEPKRKLPSAQQRAMDSAASVKRARQAQAEAEQKAESDLEAQQRSEEERRAVAKESAPSFARQDHAAMGAAAAPTASPDTAPLTEAQKIDRLIAFVGALQGAVFIRNGDEHAPADAVAHLQLKRRKAGDRVKTADDFIRLCASHSYLTKEAYLIRFADGRTRTAEDVLREELARLEAPRP